MPPLARIRPERDVYANLLRDTRGLRREHATARETWFASLPWERKEDLLFELEMLLKGLACFANPRNLPGPKTASNPAAQDFQEEMRILRDASQAVVGLTKALLGDKERAYTFSRYLESVLPEDAARGRLLIDQLSQDTPEEALFVLRNAFGHFLDLCDGLSRGGRVSSRFYGALHAVVAREVGRNAYFNPLVALEFRPEFDRIRSPEVLEALHEVEHESAHRVLAMTFLALFRALRYLALVDTYASDPATARRAYVLLAVFRSDVRALTHYLTRRAGDAIADGLEREVLLVPARDMAERYDDLLETTGSLMRYRVMLENVGQSLRVEVKKVFEHDLPSPEKEPAADLGAQLLLATAEMRASLHHAITALCAELRPGDPPPELANDAIARRAMGVRLRREVWMFRRIVRAFLEKANAVVTVEDGVDRWAQPATFEFVRDFLAHFRAIGYQLVRTHDYERIGPFLAALERLRDVDLLEPARLAEVVEECAAFYEFLGQLEGLIAARAELADVPFDREAAADVLRTYLARS